MKITSPSFKNDEIIDKKYSAYGENIFPGLEWEGVPDDAKSLAIFIHDEDAPIQSGFWHMQVVNIDPKLTKIPEGSIIDEKIGFVRNNDADQLGYLGPATPKGRKHKYNFLIFALPFEDVTKVMADNGLKHTFDSSRAYLAFFIETNAIAKAKISGYYDNR